MNHSRGFFAHPADQAGRTNSTELGSGIERAQEQRRQRAPESSSRKVAGRNPEPDRFRTAENIRADGGSPNSACANPEERRVIDRQESGPL